MPSPHRWILIPIGPAGEGDRAQDLAGAALHQADKLATDDIAQLEHYREAGYFGDTPAPYADLGQIVAGHKPGRESRDERIIAINLGLALEDMATAMPIYQRALELGIGTRLPL